MKQLDKIITNKRIIAFALITLFVVVAAVFTWPKSSQKTVEDPAATIAAEMKKFKEQYPQVADNHRFRYATADEVIRLFENGSGLVFLGFQQCPWCQRMAPIVDEAARAEKLDRIYYLDIRRARADNDATYQKLVEKLTPHLNKDEQGNPRIYVPDVTALYGGQVVGHFKQETTADGEKVTPDTYWTAERRARAVKQLREMIHKVTTVDKNNSNKK